MIGVAIGSSRPNCDLRNVEMYSNRMTDYNGWRCASCHRLITRVEDGWVEWLASEDRRDGAVVSGFRLVHRTETPGRGLRQRYCRYDHRKVFQKNKSIVEGLALESFVGPDGLMTLLSFLDSGEFPKAEILELAKRVQIPGYEVARNLFGCRIVSKAFRPHLGHGYYLQSELRELVRAANQGGFCGIHRLERKRQLYEVPDQQSRGNGQHTKGTARSNSGIKQSWIRRRCDWRALW